MRVGELLVSAASAYASTVVAPPLHLAARCTSPRRGTDDSSGTTNSPTATPTQPRRTHRRSRHRAGAGPGFSRQVKRRRTSSAGQRLMRWISLSGRRTDTCGPVSSGTEKPMGTRQAEGIRLSRGAARPRRLTGPLDKMPGAQVRCSPCGIRRSNSSTFQSRGRRSPRRSRHP